MTTFQSLTLQYPHRCRDGHPEIGHSTDGERCPVCLERDRAERAEADARGWADSFKQAEAALDSFLGPDGGKTVVELRATIEHLKALLAATQKALIIEPGKTYVIEVPDYLTTEEYERLVETWPEHTHSKAVIFSDGMRVARERVEGD